MKKQTAIVPPSLGALMLLLSMTRPEMLIRESIECVTAMLKQETARDKWIRTFSAPKHTIWGLDGFLDTALTHLATPINAPIQLFQRNQGLRLTYHITRDISTNLLVSKQAVGNGESTIVWPWWIEKLLVLKICVKKRYFRVSVNPTKTCTNWRASVARWCCERIIGWYLSPIRA